MRKYISISYLQKNFGLGYKRANEVLDMLIKNKVVVEGGNSKFMLVGDKGGFNKRWKGL